MNLIYHISPVSVILAVYGIVLIITAFVKSLYGTYSFLGGVALVGSIVLRLIEGGNLAEVFIMIFIMLLLITLAFILAVRLDKYGWILRTPISSVKDGEKEIRINKR